MRHLQYSLYALIDPNPNWLFKIPVLIAIKIHILLLLNLSLAVLFVHKTFLFNHIKYRS